MYGGMTNTFTLGNESMGYFDLTVFMNYAAGYWVNNGLLRYENAYNVWGNMSVYSIVYHLSINGCAENFSCYLLPEWQQFLQKK